MHIPTLIAEFDREITKMIAARDALQAVLDSQTERSSAITLVTQPSSLKRATRKGDHLSPAGRKALSSAMKKRWAAKRVKA